MSVFMSEFLTCESNKIYAYFLFVFLIGLFVVFDLQYDIAVHFRLFIGTLVRIY